MLYIYEKHVTLSGHSQTPSFVQCLSNGSAIMRTSVDIKEGAVKRYRAIVSIVEF